MVSLEIKIDEITPALQRVADGLGDLTEPFRDIGEYLIGATKDRFAQGVSPEGARWAPKSPVTLAIYAAAGDRADARPLFGPSKRLSNEFAKEVYPDRLEVNTPVEYAAVQQFGAAKGAFGPYSGIDKNGKRYAGSSPWGNIPARPFLGASAEDEVQIIDILGEWLEGLAEGGA